MKCLDQSSKSRRKMRLVPIALVPTSILASIALVSACTVMQPQVSPFRVESERFLDSIQTLVLAPTSLVGEFDVEDFVLDEFDSLLAGKLGEIGFDIVPANEFARIWNQITKTSGGFYDPYSGERDESKYSDATDRLFRELNARFKPDALVFPEIWEVEIPFSFGQATWGGRRQQVLGGVGYSGDIRATVLMLVVQDTVGEELFVNDVGIELLDYLQDGEYLSIPSDRILTDSTLVHAAIDSVLEPIVRERQSSQSG